MVQGKRSKVVKKPAGVGGYVSPNQLTICGFETPFEQALTSENRWVRLSNLLPWDKLATQYDKLFKSSEGRRPLNGRIVIGAVIIKHMLNLSDRETILQIQENVFMQYFLGYSSFTNEAPFDPSLFVDIRQRLSLEVMNSINEIVIAHHFDNIPPATHQAVSDNNTDNTDNTDNPDQAPGDLTDTPQVTVESKQQQPTHKGKL